MTAGIFGLVGVLIGGALSVLTSTLAERQRRQRDMRIAARLIGDDLAQVVAIINVALDRGTWSSLTTFNRGLRAWDERAPALAEAIPLDDWLALSQAIGILVITKEIAKQQAPETPLDDTSRQKLAVLRDRLATALQLLSDVAK